MQQNWRFGVCQRLPPTSLHHFKLRTEEEEAQKEEEKEEDREEEEEPQQQHKISSSDATSAQHDHTAARWAGIHTDDCRDKSTCRFQRKCTYNLLSDSQCCQTRSCSVLKIWLGSRSA